MAFGSNDGPTQIDISHDSRCWTDVVPDEWWELDHLLGREIPVQIRSVKLEQYPDSTPKPYLEFSNDPKKFRVNRTDRQTLKELFGDSPRACLGQWITITAAPNTNKTIVRKILPRPTAPPTAPAATPIAPAMPPGMTPEQFLAFQQWQATQPQLK